MSDDRKIKALIGFLLIIKLTDFKADLHFEKIEIP
jgi:hypothetical protein